MSQFYARYVPPSTKSTEPTPSSSKIEKRKRDADIGQSKSQKRAKKTRGSDELPIEGTTPDSKPSKKVSKARHANDDGKPAVELENATSERMNKDHLDEASHTKTNGVDRKTVGNDASVLSKSSLNEEKIKKKKKRKSQQLPDADEAEDEAYTRKHGGVLSKFNKSLTERPARSSPDEDEVVEPPEELHGLEPIPQPAVVDKPVEKPSFSVLPRWQSDAVRVVHRETKSFSDLHIGPSTVENLRKNGLDSTFPIQTTVLPLLLEGKDRHLGDVCISAATGSGKTLAYVLPIVEDLKEYPDVKLRGIIMVPTRELVQQVRQLCEICAAGSKLKIVVTSGSKALKDEQNLLVVEEQGYDPQKWEEEQNAPVDWANFSMAKFMQEAQEAQKPSSFHFVKQHRSKADILITTPGRLVDHLRSTPGFNLDHVKWLVVDEADRLLNESYQEWIEVVTPALQSQAATAERDRLLRQMRLEPPRREVRKVLLSATMTRDISKLNSLGLVNPKLVVLGHPQAGIQASAPDDLLDNGEDGSFHLPPSITELVVPIKDGYDKPLYLLEILQTRILGNARPKPNAEDEDSSESESDSSSSSSSSDISSDTDSASDPSSASSSESSSGSESDSEANSSTSPRHTPKSTTSPAKTLSPPTTRVLIFTRSTASTFRLSRLLTLLSPSLAPQISTLTKSTSTSASSRRALSSFRSGRTPILIATDRASRGLDIPELQHVISYDVPGSALTYVHRVGRTARAGREGTAWTCVEHREGRWFWGEVGGKGKREGKIQRVQGSHVQKVEVEVDVEGWKGRYEEALGRLGEEVKGR